MTLALPEAEILQPTSGLLPPAHSDENTASEEVSPQYGEQMPQKRRRRPALACEQCRRRKIKCDRNIPCNHCVKSKITTCSYAPTHIPASRSRKKLAPASAATERLLAAESQSQPPRPLLPNSTATAATASSSHNSPNDDALATSSHIPSSDAGSTSGYSKSNVEQLVNRIDHLEEKLARVVTITNDDSPAFSPPREAVDSHLSHGTISKTRYFGRSHWMNGAFTLPFAKHIRCRIEHGDANGLLEILTKCKDLGRSIKEHRLQPLSSTSLGRPNISRQLADQLVDTYFRTFEGVLRVLHIPTFYSEYERFWQTPNMAGDFFMVQLRLVMALGAPFLDEHYSMRAQAYQWVHEAQLWLMLPPAKGRMTIAGLQITCLLALARSVCSVGQDTVWISTGSLIRRAMHMGLHRDPSHLGDMTVYRAEMRRRLWATIMELNLQSAFDAGGPPLISWKDHDVLPPANLDDEELTDVLDEGEKRGHPSDTVTQVSLQLEIYKSLPLRLRLLEHANDFRSMESYDDTLRFNSEITKACRSMSRTLSIFMKSQQGSAAPKVNNFQGSMAELILYRCFHTLHQPVITRSIDDPKFYFSRKIYLDGALKIMSICGLAGIHRDIGPGSTTSSTTSYDFHRLVLNGSGMFRNVPIQSLPAIVLELMKKSEFAPLSMGYLPASGDFDLHSTLEAFVQWALRRIRSGETNVKGFCFSTLGLYHIQNLDRAKTAEEIDDDISLVAGECLSKSLAELRVVAQREGVPMEPTGQPVEVPQVEAMMEDIGVDWMGEGWGWDDDMAGVLWESPRPYQDAHPPIFG